MPQALSPEMKRRRTRQPARDRAVGAGHGAAPAGRTEEPVMSDPLHEHRSRRRFLSATGKGVIGVGLTAALAQAASCAAGNRARGGTQPGDPLPTVKLPDTLAPTERKHGPLPEPQRPGDRVGIAVVGLGRLALEEVLPALAGCKHARLAALVSGHPDKASTVAQRYGVDARAVYGYADFDRIADDPGVQAVYIALPNGLHAEYTVRAAKAGKHVLCEKPMANSVAEGEQMVGACAQAGRKLMIAYRLQYEPYNREVIRRARAGAFGAIRFITADNGQNLGDPRQWRLDKALAGGGALPDVGIYCLNAARYVTGEEPLEVSARLHRPDDDERFRQVEESVAFQLLFPGGTLAACTCGYGNHEHRSYRVLGSQAWAEMDNAFTYRGLRLRTGRAAGQADEVTEHRLGEQNHFALEIDHFAQCIQEDRAPRTGGAEGLADLAVIEAIYRSADAGGAPQKLTGRKGVDQTRGPVPAELT
jgi:predicted dehydrogenase